MLFNRKAQVALWVIIAIVIVAVILVIVLRPNIPFIPQLSSEINPNVYLKDCVEPKVKESMTLLSKQGGYSNPEGFIVYRDTKVKYLCYSAEYYERCIVQQPMLKSHYEKELSSSLTQTLNQCMANLKNEYEQKGYSVSSSEVSSTVSLIPKKVRIDFSAPMTVSKKDESSKTFRTFEVEINSNIYDLLMLSTSIIQFESTYGDAETSLYYQYYPDLRINKDKLSDGTTVYTLTNVVSEESFTFASRSVAWPAGYGLTA